MKTEISKCGDWHLKHTKEQIWCYEFGKANVEYLEIHNISLDLAQAILEDEFRERLDSIETAYRDERGRLEAFLTFDGALGIVCLMPNWRELLEQQENLT